MTNPKEEKKITGKISILKYKDGLHVLELSSKEDNETEDNYHKRIAQLMVEQYFLSEEFQDIFTWAEVLINNRDCFDEEE